MSRYLAREFMGKDDLFTTAERSIFTPLSFEGVENVSLLKPEILCKTEVIPEGNTNVLLILLIP
jgi:hypothetical protein